MYGQGVFINGKPFGDVYLKSRRVQEPIIVKSVVIDNGMRGLDGCFEFGDDMLSEDGKRIAGILKKWRNKRE